MEFEGTLVPSNLYYIDYTGKVMKMNTINVAIECNNEHKASVYTLATSIKVNKNEDSRYCIYILTNNTDKNQWIKLLELKDEKVDIVIYDGDISSLKDINKIIYFQWNTLVMGDLAQLYNVDLEGKSFAAAENLPEKAYSIPSDFSMYNSAVKVIDLSKEQLADDYKELSVFYNYGYEDFVKNKSRISHNKLEIIEKEYERLKDWALVLRIDKDNPPDTYFDGPLSELWIKYYKMSPIGDEPIRRFAYVETIGDVSVDTAKAIPVLMKAEDGSTPYIIAQISSVIENMDKDRPLDMRIAYKQLSHSHKDMLLGLAEGLDNVSIVLYNIQEYYENYSKGSFELLTALIFTEYSKAIFMKKGMICKSDISKLYDIDVKGYYIAAPEGIEYDEDGVEVKKNKDKDIYFRNLLYLDTNAVLINVLEWNDSCICRQIHEKRNNRAYSKYSISDILNMVCQKKMKAIIPPVEWCIRSQSSDEFNEIANTYIEKTPWSEKLQKEIIFNATREDDNVKTVLERIKKLEETNKKLRERNANLTEENANLTEEKDRYLYEILETRKSVTYKIGRLITYIPRKIRGSK